MLTRLIEGNCCPSLGGRTRAEAGWIAAPEEHSKTKEVPVDVDISIPEGKANFMENGRTGKDGGEERG
jgi:hypothetical protein